MSLVGPDARDARLGAGTPLGPYVILGPLGSGGMGEVYRARDARLARDVAIKVLPGDSSADPHRLDRFEQESKAAGALNHPNVMAVFDTGVHDGEPYIVFELLQGVTLRERLRPGPLPTRKAVEYAVQIAHGLAAAHQAGIVHRDLKPENVFVTDEGRVKILDFGLAKLRASGEAVRTGAETRSEITDAGTVLGTVAYMSPEQAEGKVADPRSDIFSFGSVFYEMLSGRRAFARDSSIETMRAILKEDPVDLRGAKGGVPSGLEQVVRRCLEKRPDERFQSARDVAFALEALSGAGAGRGFAASPRGRRRLLMGAAAFATLGLAVGAFRLRSAPPPPRVTGYTQITSDLAEKGSLVTDGPRLYFTETPHEGVSLLSQVAASGGDVARIATTLQAPDVQDTSADGSELLVLNRDPSAPLAEVWIVPVVGGTPRRVGNLRAYEAAWSPDGRSIAYTTGSIGSEVNVADSDGTGSRKIWTAAGIARWPAWSPDGHRLRVTVIPEKGAWAFWEMGADGRDPHRLLPGFGPGVCCGRWTPDGRYFVFGAFDIARHVGLGIWALREGTSWLSGSVAEPVQLALGPIAFHNPAPSRDGRKIFALGEREHGELVRYDPRSSQFVPYLSGISAQCVEFSRDGLWIVYTSYPERTLWRSRVDGKERLQLTRPPLTAMDPHWSPDGKRIVFYREMDLEGGFQSYLISADGGLPEPVPMPNGREWAALSWSPDGGTLAMGCRGNCDNTIQLLEIKTGRLSKVPGSEGTFDVIWSPDGRYLVAIPRDFLHLRLYDFASSQWRELLAGKDALTWPRFSRDGNSIFLNQGSARVRLRLADGRREVVASFEGLRVAGGLGHWAGSTPDDSVMTLRDLSVHEIFALDWEAP